MSPLITALATKLELVLARIHTAIAAKLDAADQAADSLLLEGKSAAEVRADVISNELVAINGRTGELPFFTQDGVPMALGSAELLTQLRMANDDTIITNLKNASVPFSEIFNKWKRISHGSDGVFPSRPAELEGWSYNAATDSISSTINSVSMIGIISLDRFDSYEFETIMSSTAGDDDGIGMCLAFKKVGDKEHTLTVFLSTGGMDATGKVVNGQTPKFLVIVNAGQTAEQGLNVLASIELGTAASGFNGALYAAGIRVLAKRSPTGLIEITCTKADGSAWPNPVSWSGPLPEIFQGKCSIGYVSLSQPASTWQNIKLPTSKDDIVDMRDLTVWRYLNNNWVNAGKANDAGVLTPGRLYKNNIGTMGSYYLDFEGNFITLGAPGVL